MKYFIDTEFHEYSKQPTVCGVKVGKPINTIELISIGIVSEDIGSYKSTLEQKQEYREKYNIELKDSIPYHKEYYAICKDFDLKATWDNEWLRENVLKHIEMELFKMHCKANVGHSLIEGKGDYKAFKNMLSKYGKTREQIADEILKFTDASKGNTAEEMEDLYYPEFYGYMCGYDLVVFEQLFGGMQYYPKGFPYYFNDLKQDVDSISKNWKKDITTLESYPKQSNEHNALATAKWNKELYNFINTL